MQNKEALLKLQLFLKSLYQKAIDADHKLSSLKKEGHAKFKTILHDPSLFKTQSEQFKPYVLEIAESMHALETDGGNDQQVAFILKRMQSIAVLLESFSKALKAEPSV